MSMYLGNEVPRCLVKYCVGSVCEIHIRVSGLSKADGSFQSFGGLNRTKGEVREKVLSLPLSSRDIRLLLHSDWNSTTSPERAQTTNVFVVGIRRSHFMEVCYVNGRGGLWQVEMGVGLV